MKLITSLTIEELETEVAVFYDMENNYPVINTVVNVETFEEIVIDEDEEWLLENQCYEHYADFKSKND